MQTSLARRQARRMNGGRRKRGSGAGRRALVAIPLFVFGSMALVGLLGMVAVVGVFAAYSTDLPDPHDLEKYIPIQESVVYDRTGTVELARFSSGENREIVTFDQIPPILIDATTSIEDKTFWSNTGFDPLGVLSATLDTLRGNERGASTITQQLVRQRLLDPELVRDPSRRIERKIREIIQSVRVTDAYPGEDGKKRIITAYLNQNYYGNQSYGIMAAARSYFGIQSVEDLDKLTLSQVALLAGIPQSPSSYDLVRNAEEQANGQLCVPLDAVNIKIVARRNFVLDTMANNPDRLILTGDEYTADDFEAAKDDPICLAPQTVPQWKAPHFVWSIRKELSDRLCADAETCPVLEQGGLKIVTSLDWNIQQIAEKWVTAAVLLPHEADPKAYAQQIGVPYEPWMKKLIDFKVNNGALVAMDYQTGEVIAYVGSAGYYRSDIATPQFQPQFDVVGTGWRQPGSAFKPFNYVTGIDERRMTAATMFMDVTTKYATPQGPYIPKDADLLERGPLRLRQALNFSLNIPAVKAVQRNGIQHVFEKAQEFGFNFQNEQPSAGLSLTLGTEVVHWFDLAHAYGTLANGGRRIDTKSILTVTDSAGTSLLPATEPEAAGTPVVTPQAAYIVSDILAGNTDPDQNPIWGVFNLRDASDKRRPAAFKTGTNNDAKDLTAAGFVAPPDEAGRAAGQYALVSAVWAGNSDGTVVTTPDNLIYSVDVTAPLWHGFMDEATKTWAIADFPRPGGLVGADVDAWSGGKPTQYTTKTVREIFIEGTVPGDDPIHVGIPVITDAEGNEYRWIDGCAGVPETKGFLDFTNVPGETDNPEMKAAIDDWVARARQGPGIEGGPDPDIKTKTSYFYQPGYTPYGKSWGAPFAPELDCLSAPSPSPSQTPCPSGILPVPFVTQPPIGSPVFGFDCPSPSPSLSPSPTIEVTTPPPPTDTLPPPPTDTLPPPPTDTLPPPPTDTLPPPTETPTLPAP